MAAHLRDQPALLQRARQRVERWNDEGSVARYYVTAWRELLERDLEVLCDALIEDSEHARTLRQVSPFAGVLCPRERWEILRSFE